MLQVTQLLLAAFMNGGSDRQRKDVLDVVQQCLLRGFFILNLNEKKFAMMR